MGMFMPSILRSKGVDVKKEFLPGIGIDCSGGNNFKYSSNDIELDEKEGLLLTAVDRKAYNLSPYRSLGELHEKLEVELQGETNARCRRVTYTREILEKLIKEIDEKFDNDESLRDLKKHYEDILAEMGDKDNLEKEESMKVFGEYIRNENEGPKVVLYMDTIRKIGGKEDQLFLLAEVYVHEMHHAWFDHDYLKNAKDSYIREVEEPITEFGMLSFMNQFCPDILDYALDNVKKKKIGIASCYGFGSYLYKDPLKRDWLGIYYNAKYCIKSIESCAILNSYCSLFENGLYPVDEELGASYLRVLCDALRLSRSRQ